MERQADVRLRMPLRPERGPEVRGVRSRRGVRLGTLSGLFQRGGKGSRHVGASPYWLFLSVRANRSRLAWSIGTAAAVFLFCWQGSKFGQVL